MAVGPIFRFLFRKCACGLGFAGRGDAEQTNQETNQKMRQKQPQQEQKRREKGIEEREEREEKKRDNSIIMCIDILFILYIQHLLFPLFIIEALA